MFFFNSYQVVFGAQCLMGCAFKKNLSTGFPRGVMEGRAFPLKGMTVTSVMGHDCHSLYTVIIKGGCYSVWSLT